MQVLNWAIIKHPMNWVIVMLMLIIAGAAAQLVLTHYRTATS